MIKLGITEAGDAGLDLSWADKLCEKANIIISKHVIPENDAFIKLLVANKNRVILHCTCTGWGSSPMEPNVPDYHEVYAGILNLISNGFPANQIVLRIDPIIPFLDGLDRAENVLKLFSDTGIKRCRYSIIDMYSHTKRRIISVYGQAPFYTFQPPIDIINGIKALINKYSSVYDFESCAECFEDSVGCISKEDLNILHVEADNTPSGFQRRKCLCLNGKTELLSGKRRCPSGCLYCYWKD